MNLGVKTNAVTLEENQIDLKSCKWIVGLEMEWENKFMDCGQWKTFLSRTFKRKVDWQFDNMESRVAPLEMVFITQIREVLPSHLKRLLIITSMERSFI